MNARLETAMQHWNFVAPLLQPARNEQEYADLVEASMQLLMRGGGRMKRISLPGWRIIWANWWLNMKHTTTCRQRRPGRKHCAT